MAHRPDVLFYLAGADPYVGDQLGGLALTKGGLRQRDRLVVEAALDAGVALVVALAGGYAEDMNDNHRDSRLDRRRGLEVRSASTLGRSSYRRRRRC